VGVGMAGVKCGAMILGYHVGMRGTEWNTVMHFIYVGLPG